LTPGFEAERIARPKETDAIAGSIKALDAALVAKKIVRGIESKRFYIIIGATSKFYFRLKGLVPEIFLSIVDRDVRKAQKSVQKTGHKQDFVLHDILAPSACLPEHNALNRGGTTITSGAHQLQAYSSSVSAG
jgi:hypothetical protein